MPTYERLDYGSSDGSQWGGASTDPLAFYGSIPVAQIGISSTISTLTMTSTDIAIAVSTIFHGLVTVGLFRRT